MSKKNHHFALCVLLLSLRDVTIHCDLKKLLLSLIDLTEWSDSDSRGVLTLYTAVLLYMHIAARK